MENVKYEELPIVFTSDGTRKRVIPKKEWEKIVALYESGDADD